MLLYKAMPFMEKLLYLVEMDVGDWQMMRVPVAGSYATAKSKHVLTIGRQECEAYGERSGIWVSDTDDTPIAAGDYRRTALEPCEYWCARGPYAEGIHAEIVSAEQPIIIPEGSRFVVLHGTAMAGEIALPKLSFVRTVSKDTELHATDPAVLFVWEAAL